MQMQAQQFTFSGMKGVTTGQGAQSSTTSGLHESAITSITTGEVTFENWTISSSTRLPAIAQVSRDVAGELESFKIYVDQWNSDIQFWQINRYPCQPLSQSPRAFNYHVRVEEAERIIAARPLSAAA